MPSFCLCFSFERFKGNVVLSIIICHLWEILSIFTKFDFVSESTDQYKLKVRIAQV